MSSESSSLFLSPPPPGLQSTGNSRMPGELSGGRKGWDGRVTALLPGERKEKPAPEGLAKRRLHFRRGNPRGRRAIKLPHNRRRKGAFAEIFFG